MSHLKVKTTYITEGSYGSSETHVLYCHHNNTCDCVTFYEEDGSIATMNFHSWSLEKDLWHAMNLLWYPFKDEWGLELKDGVEYYVKGPWEE